MLLIIDKYSLITTEPFQVMEENIYFMETIPTLIEYTRLL